MNEIVEKILELIRTLPDKELVEALDSYHANDIANAFEFLERNELDRLYRILPNEMLSEIFTYLEEPAEYASEMDNGKVADILEEMDSDDAVDFLEELEDSDEMEESDVKEIKQLVEPEAMEDIKLITSYEDGKIGSMMTTNYITIKDTMTIKQSMRSVISQANDNDNINVIYVVKEDNTYLGVMLLRDLICARSNVNLDDFVKTSYPVLYANQESSECYDTLRDYDLDSIAVLDDENHIVGIITKDDILEIMEQEMQEDYAKLAGMSEIDDINEPVRKSILKRIPWLILLLVISLFVSMITSSFENIILALTTIVFFQSLILDMAGNVGTQSLAVTIQSISDGRTSGKEIGKMIGKEVLTGFLNGLIVGIGALIVITLFLYLTKGDITVALKTSVAVSISLICAMTASSFMGTTVPVILTKIKIDPATASGPFITTLNDIVAILIYYGLASFLFYVL